MQSASPNPRRPLLPIPVHDVGPRFAIELIHRVGEAGRALIDDATAGTPAFAMKLADAASRRWLRARRYPYLDEIDEVARHVARPGCYYFNLGYEWGCTCAARPAPSGASARLVRVLDWNTNGIGRHIVAARIPGPAGPWISLTWPGYTGALQAMAPGRFAAAINQPPMRGATRIRRIDWALDKARFWRRSALTPAHLLRRVFEGARSFQDAKAMLIATPLCAPAIYTLAGLAPEETCVIERLEAASHVVETGAAVTAANDWQIEAWCAHRYIGERSPERQAAMRALTVDLAPDFGWLQPPILGPETRLVMVADAREGRLVAQGWEADGPATLPLALTGARAAS